MTGVQTCALPISRAVTLALARDAASQKEASTYPLLRRADVHGEAGIWEIELDAPLHGWLYWYLIDGAHEGFDAAARVLDPYARAALGREGPGIVLDPAWVGRGDRSFATPAWQDLVIAEAHVRDLACHAPVDATPAERRGFTGLRKWVESDDFHLHRLGVNCVELQPVHEFDDVSPAEYHWGYMTNNFLAPESSYALAPAGASGVREMQELVAAFHRRGMAVLLDVVFNHVGVPAHLLRLDRLYYFEQDAAGALTNWSGAIAGLLLIVCGGLVQAALPGFNSQGFALIPLPLTLQVPALLLTALVCGARSAMLAGVAYISLGLFQLPVFQAGGGLGYVLDPGFGYIAGFLPAAWLSGRLARQPGMDNLLSLTEIGRAHV